MKWRLILLCVAGIIAFSSSAAASGEPTIVDYTNGNAAEGITLEIQAVKKGRFELRSKQRLRVYAVDDTPVKEPGLLAKALMANLGENVDEVRLLPGKHRILLHATGKISCGWAYLWFVAEPEKRYAAKFEFDRLQYRVWIEDMSSGEAVGGMVGSNDEPEPKVRSQEMYDATKAKCFI